MNLVLAAAIVSGLIVHRAPNAWAERWFLIDGPDFRPVSRAYFSQQRHDGGCMHVEQRRYDRERVVVHLCYV